MLVSAVIDRRASTDRAATGTVAEVLPGDWMLVTNSGMRLPVALRHTTIYDRDPVAIARGTRGRFCRFHHRGRAADARVFLIAHA